MSVSRWSNRDDEELPLIISLITSGMVRVSEDHQMFSDITKWVESEQSNTLFLSYIEGVLVSAIGDQVDIVNQMVEGDVSPEAIAAAWIPIILSHIKIINHTTVFHIREAIAAGIRNGDSLAQIAVRILKVFGEALRARILSIAQTETLAAMNYASMKVMQEAGVPFKRWLSLMDGLERDSHHAAHWQVVPVREPFIVGGVEMMHPGDPRGPAKEVINCRCSILPEFDATRSVWLNMSHQMLFEAHFQRQVSHEQDVANAVEVAFMEQQAKVQSIINRYV